MKSLSLTCALLLAVVAPAFAKDATGAFHVVLEGARVQIEFNAATTDTTGGGNGRMKLSAQGELPDVDEDDPFGQKGAISDLSVDVEFDCVRIEGKRAAMSGLVRKSSVTGYTGRRLILTVEDAGEGKNSERDKFTWGAYFVTAVRWTPSDSELKEDDGWSRVWITTDAEREDDRGIMISRDAETDCRTFHLGAYTLVEVPLGGGNIQVRP